MKHLVFSFPERILASTAGTLNIMIGLAFFFLPELHLPLWPVSISSVLARFIGAIIIANGVGALWLSTESEWARVRPLALVATVYGTLVALGLLYHLLWLNASSFFWLYFAFDAPFLLVFYSLFVYHDIAPRLKKRGIKQVKAG